MIVSYSAYTYEQAAERLGASQADISLMIAYGDLRSLHSGYVTTDSVERLLRASGDKPITRYSMLDVKAVEHQGKRTYEPDPKPTKKPKRGKK